MAILKGFPPSNTISPSVRIAEKDLSFIAPEQSTHTAGLVGFASKGPVNLPIAIATSRQLHTIFGNPHPDMGDPFLIYAADQYLLVANTLYVVRVADTDPVSDEQATTASVDVLAAGSVIEIEADGTAGPYTFDEDSFFRWKLNGQLSTKTLVVLMDTYTTDELVIALNDQLDTILDGIEFYANSSDEIGVKTVWAYGPSSNLELVSIQNAIYGGSVSDTDSIRDNPTGLGTGMTRASVTGSNDRWPINGYQVSGHYEFTGLTDQVIEIVIDGTDNVLIDQVVQTITISDGAAYTSINDVLTDINDQKAENGGTLPGGWTALASGTQLRFVTNHHGVDARLRIKPTSTEVFGLSTLTVTGTSPEGTTGSVDIETFGKVNGGANSGGDVSFVINADSPGIDGNYSQVVITNSSVDSTFNLEVYANDVQVESWGNLTKDVTSRFYVETYLALVSDYVRVADNTSVGAGPASGTYDLVGGSDGIPADPDEQDVLLMGSPLGYTGIYTLSEPEQVNIDLIAVPGHSSTAVVQELLMFCRDYRQDCLAIIDTPFGLTVKEVVAWQNGAHPLNTTRFDSDFGALYWPWVKIYDPYNKVDVWCPPSGSIMAVIARSDFLGAPWFAPAGLNRGVVPNITDVYSRPTLEERDTMYGNRNCVNPIIQFADVQGFVVFGQKTLQRTPTALDRVNVRRLMFYIEKAIRTASRTLLFDPNDDIFQQKFISIAENILTQVQVGRGLTAYIIKADAELNTADVIDRNEFRARIGVQPTRAAEFMFIEFSIHRTGSFVVGAETF
jgi:phage tail sheath protein FI